MKKTLIVVFVQLVLSFNAQFALANQVSCEGLFLDKPISSLLVPIPKSEKILTLGKELSFQASSKMSQIPELQYMREEAEKMGLRVWLFDGTASKYLYYVKLNLAREKGHPDIQANRFDFDLTNIFRSNQALEIVIDGSEVKARKFQNLLTSKFPHFLGSVAAKWNVRTLRTRMGRPGDLDFKEALLGSNNLKNQYTDSSPIGMVEVTRSDEPVIRDVRNWDFEKNPFLDDTVNNRISFYRNSKLLRTTRNKSGQSPEILSVASLLAKAFQFELKISDADFAQMKEIVDQFDPNIMTDSQEKLQLSETAKELVMNAANFESAMNKLDELGLRKKLIAMGNKDEINSASWWLNKEPLRSKAVGVGSGKTAKELGIEIVAHETSSFLAYESITHSHLGEPNVLISRKNVAGEVARMGDGFYVQIGKNGARGTGWTIRFQVDPNAREGTDFKYVGSYAIFQNKKALRVIHESLNLEFNDLVKRAENVDFYDLALVEKLKRKLSFTKINNEVEKLLNSRVEQDQERLLYILSALQNSSVSKLISSEAVISIVKNVYRRIKPLASSNHDVDHVRYIQTTSSILKMIEAEGLLTSRSFFGYLDHLSRAPEATFAIRKLVAFEKIIATENFEISVDFKEIFSKEELPLILNEIKAWQKSLDFRKRKFAHGLNQKWTDALENGEIHQLQALTESGIFDVNYQNASGYSTLLLADYFNQKSVIDWLIANRDFDFNSKNNRGFNQVEQLRLLGKNELADRILQERRDAKARNFRVRERNSDGTPIIDFVKIDPKPFFMGYEKNKVLVTLTKPFELMSIKTTQQIWREVIQLAEQHLPRAMPRKSLKLDPSYFVGNTLPVEQVSFDDVGIWLQVLNKLSQKIDPQVQTRLAEVFPGHKPGAIYRLPTEAESEFVQRNQGLAEGNYSFGHVDEQLSASSWFLSNADGKTHPVGQKKPIMVNGRPIYDIQGNVSEWVGDWFDQTLSGGTDPVGPSGGWVRVVRGGGISYNEQHMRAGVRSGYSPDFSDRDLGFRLARTTVP